MSSPYHRRVVAAPPTHPHARSSERFRKEKMAVTSTVGYISHMMLKEPLRSEAIDSPSSHGLLTLGEPLIKCNVCWLHKRRTGASCRRCSPSPSAADPLGVAPAAPRRSDV
eukprot:COSAG05_NODE_796_length_7262_cov_8.601284_2_plen_111_part_00